MAFSWFKLNSAKSQRAATTMAWAAEAAIGEPLQTRVPTPGIPASDEPAVMSQPQRKRARG